MSSRGVATISEAISITFRDVLGTTTDDLIQKGNQELKREGEEGARALASLISEMLACRSKDIWIPIRAARELNSVPELLAVLHAISSASAIAPAPSAPRFVAELIGGGRVGWTDGTASSLRDAALKAMNSLDKGQKSNSLTLLRFSTDLTKTAIEGHLMAPVAREAELKHLIQILCRQSRNNPLLISESRIATKSLVEMLAQRIAEGEVPLLLERKRIIALDLPSLVAESDDWADFQRLLKSIVREAVDLGDIVLVLDDVVSLIMAMSPMNGPTLAANMMKATFSGGGLQCIGMTKQAGQCKFLESDHLLGRHFQEFELPKATKAECISFLQSLKHQYEAFHAVIYADDALEAAVNFAERDDSDISLLDKAMQRFDQAGARVKMRLGARLDEVDRVGHADVEENWDYLSAWSEALRRKAVARDLKSDGDGMFEKYTEKARRMIFFARHEASQLGSPSIETEHLLLGLLREDKALANRFLRASASLESIRKQIEAQTILRPQGTNVDLPLSEESKRVLAHAADEAAILRHKHIGTEHVLLGLLREEKCFAADILHERGLRLSTTQQELGRAREQGSPSETAQGTSVLSRFGRDLTQAAIEGHVHPLVDRETEVTQLGQILCCLTNKNPVLIGGPEAINTSIVEALAKNIAEGNVPSFLQDKRIVALDLALLEVQSGDQGQFKNRLKSLMSELTASPNTIIFIEELLALRTSISADGWLDAASILGPPLLSGTIQCIAATTAWGYRNVIGKHRLFSTCFHQVGVSPPTEHECVKILASLKERYEKFHRVTFSDDAIAAAIELAKRDDSEGSLLTKIMSLLDDAGARSQIRRDLPPPGVREVQKRIRFIASRMESALTNHEFEKARFYSDEERKERETLRGLKDTDSADTANIVSVSRKDLEETFGLWPGAATV